MAVLDFEKPIVELEQKVAALRVLVEAGHASARELRRREEDLDRFRRKVLQRLNRWQKVQLARHMDRPHAVDYVQGILEEFVEIHGDRMGHEDPAVVGGLGRLAGIPLVVVAQEKGRTPHERVKHRNAMCQPEGNRKALRLLNLAERFGRPVLSLVDTPGAYPGVDAEARGQATAIADNLLRWSTLRTPSLSVIIGEGGSGGALALAMTDRVLMMEHAIYSVISPEACAAILWRDKEKKAQAAEALRLTARDAVGLGLIDEIVPEPASGAHRDQKGAVRLVKDACHRHLEELLQMPLKDLLAQRYRRYRGMGVVEGEQGGRHG